MANFVVIIDPDHSRRDAFIARVAARMAPFDGLAAGTITAGDMTAAWAAEPRAPVEKEGDASSAGVLWGRPLAALDSAAASIATIRAAWRGVETKMPPPMDGYFAAVTYDERMGLIAGADLLGCFPVVYCELGQVLLVGSSPELFSHHPLFRPRLSARGLAGILLTMHSVLGDTLWEGVRRLAAGHLLTWKPDRGAREVLQYRLPVDAAVTARTHADYLDLIEAVFEEAVRRHMPPDQPHGFLLSGGLDSRVVAACAHENGTPLQCLTMGIESDIEVQCARRVSRELQIPQTVVEPIQDGTADARRKATWEHGCTGFAGTTAWTLAPHLRSLPPRLGSGYLLNEVIGPRFGIFTEPVGATPSFENVLPAMTAYGFPPDTLRQLLRRDRCGPVVDEVLEGLKKQFEGYAGNDQDRAWCMQLHTRQRFHVAGVLWPHTFGSWPAVPALDQRLLHSAFALPRQIMDERYAEERLLIRRAPRLAKIPLDRNKVDTSPLIVSEWRRRLSRYFPALAPKNIIPVRHIGQLRYMRVYDFNSPSWRAVRREAEPFRRNLLDVLDERTLNALLPGPDVEVRFKRPIKESCGLKTLAGLLLWSAKHSNT